jgi:hypothetical protein
MYNLPVFLPVLATIKRHVYCPCFLINDKQFACFFFTGNSPAHPLVFTHTYTDIYIYTQGHTVAYMVEALCYQPEGCRFNS